MWEIKDKADVLGEVFAAVHSGEHLGNLHYQKEQKLKEFSDVGKKKEKKTLQMKTYKRTN